MNFKDKEVFEMLEYWRYKKTEAKFYTDRWTEKSEEERIADCYIDAYLGILKLHQEKATPRVKPTPPPLRIVKETCLPPKAEKVLPCDLPTPGWRCNGDKGHPGPCAAWPDTFGLRVKWAWRLKSLSILFGRHL